MFHSLGIVQSNTGVPVGTSCTVKGRYSCMIARVCLTPLPDMLRQIGKSLVISWYISSPIFNVALVSIQFMIPFLSFFINTFKYQFYREISRLLFRLPEIQMPNHGLLLNSQHHV